MGKYNGQSEKWLMKENKIWIELFTYQAFGIKVYSLVSLAKF